MATAKRARQAIKAAWNYADVIALATASLKPTTLNGDRGAWMTGISKLAESYPKYFARVHFIHRRPLPPYSREVDEVLKMLGKWEYQGMFNPKFRTLNLGDAAKAALKEQLEGKFTKDEQSNIEEMSKLLEEHVVVPDREADNVGSAGQPAEPSR